MEKMLFVLVAVVVFFTGCGSRQASEDLLKIDLTAKSFVADRLEIADEIESIEYIPL
ncbi:MAG: hypothetical protein LUJ25_09095 [Firmicutes bacterium]|nr:hypothetical protein [Bacillota bacterium]